MLTDELETKLVALGLTTGYTTKRDIMPATPDKVISIYGSGGSGPSVAFGGSAVENPTAQFVVRGEPNDADAPRETIEAIYQWALNSGAFTVSSVRYLSLTPLQPPFVKNRDGNQRVEYAFNAAVEKELSPTS